MKVYQEEIPEITRYIHILKNYYYCEVGFPRRSVHYRGQGFRPDPQRQRRRGAKLQAAKPSALVNALLVCTGRYLRLCQVNQCLGVAIKVSRPPALAAA
jgi:hypothetical protein